MKKPHQGWRRKLYTIIFEADTPAGKLFDVVLIGSIILSVIAVMLDSVSTIRQDYGKQLYIIEWFFTLLFTIEYIMRIICVDNKRGYIFSFFGIVDFLAIIPTYIGFFVPASRYLLVIRSLRILRIFRVLKLVQYVNEANFLKEALKASRRKIFVFLFAVLTLVVIAGSLMYVIEGAENGFTSIPRSIYWAIVTLTTVGFGDIAPQTGLGQALASMIMILGYGIIAVPTGIVSYEMANTLKSQVISPECPQCHKKRHEIDANFCNQCGAKLLKE
ncbi:MAG: ion transporter [Candidatus Halalkalibacterium sp. M3_1C_030]